MTPLLEDFGPIIIPSDPDASAKAEAETEEERLALFERGYTAGWDDAIKAQAQNTSIASEAFAQAMKDLSFTYHEASQHIAGALGNALFEVTRQIVPQALEVSLIAMISEELKTIAIRARPTEIVILCAPSRAGFLNQGVPADLALPVRIEPDLAIGRDEVRLRFETSEQQICVSQIAEQIETAVAGINHHIQEDLFNG